MAATLQSTRFDLELSDRRQRALEEYLTVTPDLGPARAADGLVIVTSQSGREYLVDVEVGRCQRKDGATCPDQEYNLDDGDVCKHIIRGRIATGQEPLSADELRVLDVDPQLGQHCDGPRIITSAGGVVGDSR